MTGAAPTRAPVGTQHTPGPVRMLWAPFDAAHDCDAKRSAWTGRFHCERGCANAAHACEARLASWRSLDEHRAAIAKATP